MSSLREAIAGRENAAEAYIWTRQNRYTAGRPEALTCAALSKVLARVSRHASIDRVSPHLLRATGASLAVAAGVPESIAAKQLGNSPAIARKHYLRLPVIEPLRQIGAVFE